MQSAATTVRPATPADVPPLTRMLARAFFDDPVAVWTCRSDAQRAPLLEGMYRTRLQHMLAQQEVWTTPEHSSAALWAAPGQWQTGFRQDAALLPYLLHPHILLRLPLLTSGLSAIRRRHPPTPHWYLSLLGTDPDAQGRGLGSALLEQRLKKCDSEGAGAYLESSKQRNVDFYARHGFRLTGELRLPRGPKLWVMWREPRR
jgi:ribosomal protein S18 acetylase RimI-like enzyme